MEKPSLLQLFNLLKINKDVFIQEFISKENFIFIFLEHLTEHFKGMNHLLTLQEPLLDSSSREQKTTLSINQIEIGEMILLCNSFNEESSLVYYSPSGLIESILIDFENYDTYKISDYIFLIHEFSFHLLGEKMLYEK